jgi:uncharacterized Rmd1/YagE family protein
MQLAEDTKTLPETLAAEGDVKIPRKEINKLIGEARGSGFSFLVSYCS